MKYFSIFTKNGRVDLPIKDEQAREAASIVKNPLTDVVEKVRELSNLSNQLTKKQEQALGNKVEKITFKDVDGREIVIDNKLAKGGPGSGSWEGPDNPRFGHVPSWKNQLQIEQGGSGKKYEFHMDPGHGWLKVPKKDIIELGLQDKISGYSYMDKDHVYLEEDSDATEFHNALKARTGGAELSPDSYSHTIHTDNQSPIRNFTPYKPEDLKPGTPTTQEAASRANYVGRGNPKERATRERIGQEWAGKKPATESEKPYKGDAKSSNLMDDSRGVVRFGEKYPDQWHSHAKDAKTTNAVQEAAKLGFIEHSPERQQFRYNSPLKPGGSGKDNGHYVTIQGKETYHPDKASADEAVRQENIRQQKENNFTEIKVRPSNAQKGKYADKGREIARRVEREQRAKGITPDKRGFIERESGK